MKEKQSAMPTKTDRLLDILREFQKIDPEFPLQYAICLLEISQDEGLSITTLAERTGLTLSTVSRIVGALAKKRQKGRPYDLIKTSFAKDQRRRKELTLTTKGRAVIKGLEKLA